MLSLLADELERRAFTKGPSGLAGVATLAPATATGGHRISPPSALWLFSRNQASVPGRADDVLEVLPTSKPGCVDDKGTGLLAFFPLAAAAYGHSMV